MADSGGVISEPLTLSGRLAIVSLVFALAPALHAQGYVPRASGWDLDLDGRLDPDPKVCDSSSGAAAPELEQLWGDDELERSWYVDCERGTDSPDCGSPEQPCRSLGSTMARGRGGDVFCVSGSCPEGALRPPAGERELVQHEGRSYPAQPTVVAGWDRDGDNAYPPHDVDDSFVLDGSGLRHAFSLSGGFLRIAHLRAVDFAQDCPLSGGFIDNVEPAEAVTTGVWIHDVETAGILQDCVDDSGRIWFEAFGAWAHVNIENCLIDDQGGYLTLRGSGGPGPWRMAGCTIRSHGADGAAGTFLAKPWGGWNAPGGSLFFENNVFDCNSEAWEEECHGINVAQCTQNVVVRGNRFVDYVSMVGVQGYATGVQCAAPVTNLLVEANVLESTNGLGAVCVALSDDEAPSGYGWLDVEIYNNTCRWSGESTYEDCIRIFGGSAQPDATVKIVGNTCHGRATVDGRRAGLHVDSADPTVFFYNNVIDGRSSRPAVWLPEGAEWHADGNLYAAGGWAVGERMLAIMSDWRAASHGDASSKLCKPKYVDEPHDLHLAPDDTCARGAGVDVSSFTDVDRDGEPRGLDIGSDQVDGNLP